MPLHKSCESLRWSTDIEHGMRVNIQRLRSAFIWREVSRSWPAAFLSHGVQIMQREQ